MASSQDAESTSLDADADVESQSVAEKPKAKRQRRTAEEMARSRAAKLDSLMLMDTTGWSQKKIEIHQNDIRQLSAKVNEDKADAEKRQMTARTKSSSEAQTKVPRAPPMSDVHNRRLIYARAKLDAEFEKKINKIGYRQL